MAADTPTETAARQHTGPATATAPTAPAGALKADAIGFLDALAIGLNATSPAPWPACTPPA